ncbi:DUF4304 domain-containing protein [Shewanella cyperi]|uniref:DUF4304 domain-containing protein n=1 Tax=Shewanella cyperi TaxID=2814292 RepID=A0A974XL08_9GAMM|nr:DUF4304 domain-containing protein [Shewanella cyperi]QSX30355.1 DUF4304 domain-containing protein [Shewanella cyperi]
MNSLFSGVSAQGAHMLNEFITLFISPILKKYGFKKQGLKWNRTVGDVIQVIDIQKQKYGQLHFTINVGVLHTHCGNAFEIDMTKFINEVVCFPRFRLKNYVLDSQFGNGEWWPIGEEVQWQMVGGEVSMSLERILLPVLDEVNSAATVLKFAEVFSRPNLPPPQVLQKSILLYLMGEVDESQKLIEVIASGNSWEKRAGFVRIYIRKLSNE